MSSKDRAMFENEMIRSVAHHETFISWQNDRDAEFFVEWLYEEGFAMFDKWKERQGDI